MSKLTVLVIEVEPPEGLSARKLVLETARHNVITAYSGKEGLKILHRFPNVDAVVLHSELRDIDCGTVTRAIKNFNAKLPIIVVSPRHTDCDGADFVVPSHEPQELLNLLADKFGASKSVSDNGSA